MPGQAWAESGASLGVCVLLRTKADRLQVTLGGQTLHSVAPPAAAPLRARAWRAMRVRHARRAAGLSVWLDGVPLLSGVLLPGFAPTKDWRFGFGARSGPNYAMLEERHDVRLASMAVGRMAAVRIAMVRYGRSACGHVRGTARRVPSKYSHGKHGRRV